MEEDRENPVLKMYNYLLLKGQAIAFLLLVQVGVAGLAASSRAISFLFDFGQLGRFYRCYAIGTRSAAAVGIRAAWAT